MLIVNLIEMPNTVACLRSSLFNSLCSLDLSLSHSVFLSFSSLCRCQACAWDQCYCVNAFWVRPTIIRMPRTTFFFFFGKLDVAFVSIHVTRDGYSICFYCCFQILVRYTYCKYHCIIFNFWLFVPCKYLPKLISTHARTQSSNCIS